MLNYQTVKTLMDAIAKEFIKGNHSAEYKKSLLESYNQLALLKTFL